MRKLFIFILSLTSVIMCAQSSYERQMESALKAMGKGDFLQARTQLEHLIHADTANWIPQYYLVLTELKQVFRSTDREEQLRLISKIKPTIAKYLAKETNVEWLVLSAFCYTAELTTDPINKGAYLTEVILDLYDQALKIDPQNPRVLLEETAFKMETARFYNQDLKPFCMQLSKMKSNLVSSPRATTAFYPNWEQQRLVELLKTCAN